MPGSGPRLVRAHRRTFAGPAEFLSDPGNRAAVGAYLSDLVRRYPPEPATLTEAPLVVSPEQGHSYGEMAEALISAVTSTDQPVDLLVLAFAIHDLQPGRATATYLSHVCPGAPMSFAICDQGSAAAFSGLRVARDYVGSAGFHRALLIVVEQAMLPYDYGAPRPALHRGVAMLFESDRENPAGDDSAGDGSAGDGWVGAARLVGLRQRPDLAAAAVADQASADLAELSAGYREVRLVLSQALAEAWPRSGERVRVGPAAQPSTGAWWRLLDELAEPGHPDLLVAADYDASLGYLCLAAIAPG